MTVFKLTSSIGPSINYYAFAVLIILYLGVGEIDYLIAYSYSLVC